MSEYQLAKKAAVIGGSSWLYLGDVRDRAHPVWLGDIRTTASPGRAIDIDGRIFIPGRYAGLRELREKS